MTIRLITGVPGTGKTAFLVSELEKVVATGRKVFVHNVHGLKIEHYRAGRITDWQKGTWLHIDVYQRRSPELLMEVDDDDEVQPTSWRPRDDVQVDPNTGEMSRTVYDPLDGSIVGSVPYESHKGALLVIDEAQDYFRPRPSGSFVPDHVAALEVHRHQGLDIWLVTQRPSLIDINVRALVGQHIAFRSTSLGRYKYVWSEVGDIESKTSRDLAVRTRFRLPKHVFNLYKSAEVHTVTKHPVPMAAKILIVVLPVAIYLIWNVFEKISGKVSHESQIVESVSVQHVDSAAPAAAVSHPVSAVPASTVPASAVPVLVDPSEDIDYNLYKIKNFHPYQSSRLSIVARVKSATRDVYRFSVLYNGRSVFYLSSGDLVDAGYTVVPLSDCSVKLIYDSFEFFVTCGASPSIVQPGYVSSESM